MGELQIPREISATGAERQKLSLDEFTSRIDKALGTRSSAVSFNKSPNVGVVSGGDGLQSMKQKIQYRYIPTESPPTRIPC
jgi:hypothetical protein